MPKHIIHSSVGHPKGGKICTGVDETFCGATSKKIVCRRKGGGIVEIIRPNGGIVKDEKTGRRGERKKKLF